MWFQHPCMLSILSTCSILIYSIISLRISFPEQLLSVKNFKDFTFTESIEKTIQANSYTEIYDCIVCLLYWLNAYITDVFSYKFALLRHRLYKKGLDIFWDLVVKSFIWLSTFSFIYTFIILLDKIGSFDNLFIIHFNKIFNTIHSENISFLEPVSDFETFLSNCHNKCHFIDRLQYFSGLHFLIVDFLIAQDDQFIMYSNYFENIQKRYQCCGIYSIEDWFSVLQYQMNNVEIVNESQYPWKPVYHHILKSCCSPNKAINCSSQIQNSIKQRVYPLRNYQSFQYGTFSLYTNGCLNKVVTAQQQLMYTFVTKYGIVGICLHVIRLTTFYVIYNHTQLRYSNKPVGNKLYSLMSLIYPFEKRSYISNSQLLTACQSCWLFGQPFEKLKSQWLENNMRIGWMLLIKRKHCITFLRRMHLQKQCRQLSKFHQFLRYSIPTFEMITYADGRDREEIEANITYDGFIVRISRIVCFLLFGLFISEFLLFTVIPTKNEAASLPSGDNKIPNEIIQRDAEILRNGVDWITKTFIRMTITLAAVVSYRFRCLLLLIIPSLGQTIGLSYLGNELLHVYITGPVLNLEHNLRSTSESLICFIKLASNMTRDVSDFIEKSKETIEAEGDLSYIETIKAKSAQLKEKINHYNVSIQNLNIEIDKAEILAKRAESFLIPSVNKTNVYAQLSLNMAKQAKDEMSKKIEASKANIISMMKDNHVNNSILSQIFNRIEDGLRIENSIEKRMQITCMVFFKTRSIICKQSSIKACSRLQTILIATTRYPILIKKMCLRKIASGVACPTNQALENAVNQCSSSLSKIGFSSGFGSLFVQAQHDLYKIQQAFHFTVQHRLLQSEEIIKWFNQNSEVIDRISQHTKDTIYVIFKLSFILTYLLRSLCLIVFYKAHRYITNYLLDLDYDNIYIETEFEQIDHKRSAESREVLLPLKSYELNNVVWHQKMYTEAELKRVIQSLIKVIGFGFCLSLLFFIDFYMTKLVQVLDEVTSTTFTIGNKQNNQSEEVKQTNTKLKTQELNLLGDGIFTDLLYKTIKIVQHASNIDLLYDLSVCSPKAEFLRYKHFIHFCILWLLMIIICLLSGYMLRLRHKLLDFFYPQRSKYRVIHLYNELLVNRRRHMTTARNLLVHLSRQNRLQAENEERSHRSLLCSMNSLLGNMLRLNKMNCIVCMERYAIGKESLLYVCPYDGTAICQYCSTTLFNNHKVCITCLDRNYKRLGEINENVSTLKEIIINE
ncbi:hypothetical protein MN116_003063 [Schistosoma mekongi]|uniref:Dendritic cell-specific transmembrane protein-like domain-containing protein n=1 Tax=Schistosoma mekongi TaxID=38744 RepID=A0AAE1ZGM7_SCHME|nr:hypothetical protein MN116_003063 [Schistosoma mekongi]